MGLLVVPRFVFHLKYMNGMLHYNANLYQEYNCLPQNTDPH